MLCSRRPSSSSMSPSSLMERQSSSSRVRHFVPILIQPSVYPIFLSFSTHRTLFFSASSGPASHEARRNGVRRRALVLDLLVRAFRWGEIPPTIYWHLCGISLGSLASSRDPASYAFPERESKIDSQSENQKVSVQEKSAHSPAKQQNSGEEQIRMKFRNQGHSIERPEEMLLLLDRLQ